MKYFIPLLLLFLLGLIIGAIIALITQLKGVYFKKLYSLPADKDFLNYKNSSEARKYINDKRGTGNNSDNRFNKEVN